MALKKHRTDINKSSTTHENTFHYIFRFALLILLFNNTLYASGTCKDDLQLIGITDIESFNDAASNTNISNFYKVIRSKNFRNCRLNICSDEEKRINSEIFEKCGIVKWVTSLNPNENENLYYEIDDYLKLKFWREFRSIIINNPGYWTEKIICAHPSELRASQVLNNFKLHECKKIQIRDVTYIKELFTLGLKILTSDSISKDVNKEMNMHLNEIRDLKDTTLYNEITIPLNLSKAKIYSSEKFYVTASAWYAFWSFTDDVKSVRIYVDKMHDLYKIKNPNEKENTFKELYSEHQVKIEKNYGVTFDQAVTKFKHYIDSGEFQEFSTCKNK